MGTWTIRNEAIPQLCPAKQRTPGLHLTDVLKRIESYRLDLQGKQLPEDPYEHSLYAEYGQEFEWAFKQRLKLDNSNMFDPGELCVNVGTDADPVPLYLTPDLMEPLAHVWSITVPQIPNSVRVLDCKWTTKSSDTWDPRLETPATQYIRDQLKCYCHVANTVYGGFFIRYFRGNRYNEQISHLSINVTFEPWEIYDIWTDVVVMARSMHKELNQ